MQPIFDELFADLLPEVFAEFGMAAVYRQYAAGVYNAATGVTAAPVAPYTDHATRALPAQSYNRRDIDGTRIKSGDVRIRIDGTNFSVVPKAADERATLRLLDDSGDLVEELEVVAVEEQKTGIESPVITLQCRKL